MATPAEIANDMLAHARYWRARDRNIHRACIDAAAIIRIFLNGGSVDGRTLSGIHRRLLRLERSTGNRIQAYPNFSRARMALENFVNARKSQ